MVCRRFWGGGSGRLAVLFMAVVVPPAVALVWLGLELIDQDRALWAQREEERRRAAAQAVVLSLEQALTEAERQFAEGVLPEGVVRLRLSAQGVQADPPDRMLWVPAPMPMPAAASRPFLEAEEIEYQGLFAQARLRYEDLTGSPQSSVRAGAFLRLARVARQEKRWPDALKAYRDLAALQGVAFDGTPVDLLARRMACSVLEESGSRPQLTREAAVLESDFVGGRWQLDPARWELAAAEIAHWSGHSLSLSPEREAFSQAAQWLWEEWQTKGGRVLTRQDRRIVVGGRIPITLLRQTSGDEEVAIALAPSLPQQWAQRAGQGITLLMESGDILAGTKSKQDHSGVKLAPASTGLPWTLSLTLAETGGEAQQSAGRHRMLLLGLAAIVLFLAGGSFLLWRGVRHELAVARLQTDFVATVSHEFRTPLASLRHVTELLEEDDELPRARRLSFYQALGYSTARLHRLVESLLDFARMEGRRKPYDLRPVPAAEFARRVVDDFRKEAEPLGFTIDFESEDSLRMRADEASLTHALWNLLDNAVKYSPAPGSIKVSVQQHPKGIALSVQDRGPGIPARERKEIFRKFVRGENARKLGVQGTGLGLAMVTHIVAAHGGVIELDSREGAGSTFRIVLPEEG
jgi:signal transduction histidine kinase